MNFYLPWELFDGFGVKVQLFECAVIKQIIFRTERDRVAVNIFKNA